MIKKQSRMLLRRITMKIKRQRKLKNILQVKNGLEICLNQFKMEELEKLIGIRS
jgi:hypothetical protein